MFFLCSFYEHLNRPPCSRVNRPSAVLAIVNRSPRVAECAGFSPGPSKDSSFCSSKTVWWLLPHGDNSG